MQRKHLPKTYAESDPKWHTLSSKNRKATSTNRKVSKCFKHSNLCSCVALLESPTYLISTSLSLSLFRLQMPLSNIYHPFLLLPSLMFFPSYYIPKLQMPASNSSCVRFVNFPRQSGRLPPNLSWRSRTGPKGDGTFWLHVLKITIPIVKGEPNRSKELSKTHLPTFDGIQNKNRTISNLGNDWIYCKGATSINVKQSYNIQRKKSLQRKILICVESRTPTNPQGPIGLDSSITQVKDPTKTWRLKKASKNGSNMAKLLPRSSPTGNQQISAAKLLSACPSQKGASKQWSFHRASLANPVLHLSFCQCCYLFMGALSSFLLFPRKNLFNASVSWIIEANYMNMSKPCTHTLMAKNLQMKISHLSNSLWSMYIYIYMFMLYLVLAAHHTNGVAWYT